MPIESPTFGTIYRPIAYVEVKSTSEEWKIFYPEVDSGAPLSVFNKSDCELLGYRLKEGKYFHISSVIGSSIPAYIHEVEMKVGKEIIIPVKVAFTDGLNHKQLLGRINIFDTFQVLFRGKILETSFVKE